MQNIGKKMVGKFSQIVTNCQIWLHCKHSVQNEQDWSPHQYKTETEIDWKLLGYINELTCDKLQHWSDILDGKITSRILYIN